MLKLFIINPATPAEKQYTEKKYNFPLPRNLNSIFKATKPVRKDITKANIYIPGFMKPWTMCLESANSKREAPKTDGMDS